MLFQSCCAAPPCLTKTEESTVDLPNISIDNCTMNYLL